MADLMERISRMRVALEEAASRCDATAALHALKGMYQLLDAFPEIELLHVRGSEPVPMLIWCPMCRERHVDRGDFATKPHHTHSCQRCGLTWRPAIGPTVGVQFLPGFKDEKPPKATAPKQESEDGDA